MPCTAGCYYSQGRLPTPGLGPPCNPPRLQAWGREGRKGLQLAPLTLDMRSRRHHLGYWQPVTHLQHGLLVGGGDAVVNPWHAPAVNHDPPCGQH